MNRGSMNLEQALTQIQDLEEAELNTDRKSAIRQCLGILARAGLSTVVTRYKQKYEANRVECIKEYRTEFGVPLMDAKATIEKWAATHGWKAPHA